MSTVQRNFWINQLFFQLAWPACVLGAAHEVLWPAALVIAAFLFWQLAPSRRHPADLRTLAALVVLGLALDTLWVQAELVRYSASIPWEGTQPLWLTGLWIAMALGVNHSLAVFRDRWWLWVVLASIASPLSYTMAQRLGAVEWLAPPWVVVLMLGPVWAVLTGLVFRWAGRGAGLDRQTSIKMVTE